MNIPVVERLMRYPPITPLDIRQREVHRRARSRHARHSAMYLAAKTGRFGASGIDLWLGLAMLALLSNCGSRSRFGYARLSKSSQHPTFGSTYGLKITNDITIA